MSNTTIDKMNATLYAASFHLLEAGKYLSDVEEFRIFSKELYEKALLLSSIIVETPEKVSNEKMESILNEILNFDEETPSE